MDKDQSLKKWALQWEKTNKALDSVKASELQNINIEQVIQQLDCAFRMALKNEPLRPHSGLIEMQKWFRKLEI
ncbi:hypothetical protein HQ585_01385 [candidate division KSB1 bacterium]|nr:hypothetical protein [candidate division KSB1 bacterium]